MARPRRRLPSAEGIRRWADATEACLTVMRAGLRARDRAASQATITRRLNDLLARHRARMLAAWRAHG